jgi:hypothetical protein
VVATGSRRTGYTQAVCRVYVEQVVQLTTPPPEANLRERLALAKFRHIDEEGAEWDAVEITDVILVVAAWLRDKAAAYRDQAEASGGLTMRGEVRLLERATECDVLADEIDPPKGDTNGE